MNQTEEFYTYCHEALKMLCKKGRLSPSDCNSISALHGADMFNELKSVGAGVSKGYGSLIKQPLADVLLRDEYFIRQASLVVTEDKRKALDDKSKRAAIQGTLIAKWALVLSLVSMTGIVQHLFEWLYSLLLDAVK